MHFRSFRWQLIIISLFTGGISIAAFAWFSWTQIHASKLHQLDLTLQAFASRNAAKIFSFTVPEQMNFWQDNIEYIQSEIEEKRVAVQVIDDEGSTTWTSHNWPTDLDVSQYHIHSKEPLPLHQAPENTPRQAPPRRFPPPRREGGSVFSSPPFPEGLPPGSGPRPSIDNALHFSEAFYEDSSSAPNWRFYIVPVNRGVLIIASGRESVKEEMRGITRSFLIALPVSLLLIAAGAIFIGNRAIRPVKQLTVAATNIEATHFDQRIPYRGGGEEFRQLILVYNQMLERLQISFAQAKRFSSDAAHELNTPLTILQGHLDIALQEAEDESPEQLQYSMLSGEVNQLISIVQKLLTLSRVDSGNIQLDSRLFDLTELIEMMLEDADIVYEGPEFTTALEDKVMISADRHWIQQILNNLFSNACKYNLPGGWVEVKLVSQKDNVIVEVKNSGTPIPKAAEPRLFDRFYRVEAARSGDNRSLGLGLSLASDFARLHKGKLELFKNDAESIGFRLTLPV